METLFSVVELPKQQWENLKEPWKLFCCLEDIRKEKFLTRSVTMTSSKEFNRGTLLIEETIGKVEWLKECASNEDSLIQFRVIQCLKTLQFY